MAMRMRSLAVVSITIMFVMASAVAEEVKIMGLTEKSAALLDGTKSLEYLTGSCQKKKSRMKCHLNHIEVKKIDTTLLEDKAREVMAHAKNDPQSLDNFIASHLPHVCHEPDSIQAIRFNRYRTRQIMTRNNAPQCQQGHEKDYRFVLEKPWYVDCEYIDFSPLTFGWSFWRPSAP